MQKLIEEVKELVEREYGRAGAKFGLTNNSDHESYAVLQEELEEAQDEMVFLEQALKKFWFTVRQDQVDDTKLWRLKDVQKRALLAACECIQVAAMAKKASITVCNRAATKEVARE